MFDIRNAHLAAQEDRTEETETSATDASDDEEFDPPQLDPDEFVDDLPGDTVFPELPAPGDDAAEGEDFAVDALEGDDAPLTDPNVFDDDLPDTTVFPELPTGEDETGVEDFTVEELDQGCAPGNSDCSAPPDEPTLFPFFDLEDVEAIDPASYQRLLDEIAQPLGSGTASTQPVAAPPNPQEGLAKFIPDPSVFATGARIPGSACDYKPQNICGKLGGQNAEECRQAVAQWVSTCQAHHSTHGQLTVASCQSECRMYRQPTRAENTIRPMIERIIASADAAGAQRADIEAQVAALQAEATAIEVDVQARKIHEYENTESGRILRHAGEFLEPAAPLKYLGVVARGPSVEQLQRLTDISAQLSDLRAQAANFPPASPEIGWYQSFARSLWFGTDAAPGLFSCTPSEADAAEAACLAKCADNLGSGEICDPFVTPLGVLNHPFSRIYLYPPDNPWREFGYYGE